MIIFDEDRPSNSPFVERIWCCHSEGAAPFLSIAQSRCELVVTKLHGKIILTAGARDQSHAPWRLSCGRGVVWHPVEAGHVSVASPRQNAGGCNDDSARSGEQILLAGWLCLAVS